MESSQEGETGLQPIVLGRDLIQLGFKPGPSFKTLLDQAYEHQLEGYSKGAILTLLKTKIK